MDRLISEQQVLYELVKLIDRYGQIYHDEAMKAIKAIPSAELYKGMTNGEVITKILKDAEWAELTSDIGLAQEDIIYIKVGSYWWNSPYKEQESEVSNG